jgi:hypothetical protein
VNPSGPMAIPPAMSVGGHVVLEGVAGGCLLLGLGVLQAKGDFANCMFDLLGLAELTDGRGIWSIHTRGAPIFDGVVDLDV